MKIEYSKIKNVKLGNEQVLALYKGTTKIFELGNLPSIEEKNSISYNFYPDLDDDSLYLDRESFPHVFNTSFEGNEEIESEVVINLKNGENIKFNLYYSNSIPESISSIKLIDVDRINLLYKYDYDKIIFGSTMKNNVYKINADTINVKDFSKMFMNFVRLNEIPNINIINAENVSDMFNGCYRAIGNVNGDLFWNLRSDLEEEKTKGCFSSCYRLTNYLEIPSNWKDGTEISINDDEYTTLIITSNLEEYPIFYKIGPEDVDDIYVNGVNITNKPSDYIYNENYNFLLKEPNIIKIKGNFKLSSNLFETNNYCDFKLDILKLGNTLTNLNNTFMYMKNMNLPNTLELKENIKDLYQSFKGSRINNTITIDGTNLKKLEETFKESNILVNPVLQNFNSKIILKNTFEESNIKYIDIPNEVMFIEGLCKNCKELRTINNFPDILKIGNSAFEGCISLENIPNELILANLNNKDRDFLLLTVNDYSKFDCIFKDCIKIKETPYINLIYDEKYTKVIEFNSGFEGCINLERISNIPLFDCIKSQYSSFSYLFKNCPNIEYAPEIEYEKYGFEFKLAINTETELESLLIWWYGTSKNKNVFENCTKLKNAISIFTYECYKNCTSILRCYEYHPYYMRYFFESTESSGNGGKYSYSGCTSLVWPFPLENILEKWGGGGKIYELPIINNFIKLKIDNISIITPTKYDYIYLPARKYSFYECYLEINPDRIGYRNAPDIYFVDIEPRALNASEISIEGCSYKENINNNFYDSLSKVIINFVNYDTLKTLSSNIKFNPSKINFRYSNEENNINIITPITIKADEYNYLRINKILNIRSDKEILINNNINFKFNPEYDKSKKLNIDLIELNNGNRLKLSELFNISQLGILKIHGNIKNISINVNCDYIYSNFGVDETVSLDALCDTIEIVSKSKKIGENEYFCNDNIIDYDYNHGAISLKGNHNCISEFTVDSTIKIPLKYRNKLIIPNTSTNTSPYYDNTKINVKYFNIEMPFKNTDEITSKKYNILFDPRLEIYFNNEMINLINKLSKDSSPNKWFKNCNKIINKGDILPDKIEGVFTYKNLSPKASIIVDSNCLLKTVSNNTSIIKLNNSIEIYEKTRLNGNSLIEVYSTSDGYSNLTFSDGYLYLKLLNNVLPKFESCNPLEFKIENSENFILPSSTDINLAKMFDNTEDLIPPYISSEYEHKFDFYNNYDIEIFNKMDVWNDFFNRFSDITDKKLFYDCNDYFLSNIPINFGGKRNSLDLPLGASYIEFNAKGKGIKLYYDFIDHLYINDIEININNEILNEKHQEIYYFENENNYNNIKIYYPSNYENKNYTHYIDVFYETSIDGKPVEARVRGYYQHDMNGPLNWVDHSFECGNIQISNLDDDILIIDTIKIGSNIRNINFLFQKASNIEIENTILTDAPLSFSFSFLDKVKFKTGICPILTPIIFMQYGYFPYYKTKCIQGSFDNNLSLIDIKDFINNLNLNNDNYPKIIIDNDQDYDLATCYPYTFSKCYNITNPFIYEELAAGSTIYNKYLFKSRNLTRFEDIYELKENNEEE